MKSQFFRLVLRELIFINVRVWGYWTLWRFLVVEPSDFGVHFLEYVLGYAFLEWIWIHLRSKEKKT